MYGWTDPIDEGGVHPRPEPPAGQQPYQPGPAHAAPPTSRVDVTVAAAPDSAGSARGLSPAESEAPVLSSWADHTWPGDQPSPWGGPSSRGRHRKAPRLPAPLALAAAVTTVLGLFGVAAAVLPPSFASVPGPAASEGTVAEAGGVAGSDPLLGTPPAVTPSGGPTAAAATATASSVPITPPTAARPRVARTTASPVRKPPPPPPPTTSQPSPRATGGGTQADQVLAIVNQERAANGCGAVTLNQKLASAAGLHSQDQAAHNTMSHTGSDGSSPWDRAAQAGYQWAIGENVAAGYRTPAAVMDAWMNSPGHRANILNCQAKAIGIGIAAAGDGTLYWTQMFGTQP